MRRGLAKVLEGRSIVSFQTHREGLRFPFPADLGDIVTGKCVRGVGRRAKYLLVHFTDETALLIHLGMTGKFTLYRDESEFIDAGGLAKHDHVVLTMDDGSMAIYNDTRRFGLMDYIAAASPRGEPPEGKIAPRLDASRFSHPLLDGIGVEPLTEDFSAQALCQSLRGRKTPIKTALLDQRVVAGLGNIYVCEILFRAGVSPLRRSLSVAGRRGVTDMARKIVQHSKSVLLEAIEAGGSTISDFAAVDGELGYFAHSFKVYGREGKGCTTSGCASEVKRITQSGRSTFYCPNCQR